MSSSDTPNIYQLRTNEMQDIMTPVENKISVRSRWGILTQQLYKARRIICKRREKPLGTYLGFELGWGLCIKGLGPGLYNILVHFSSTSYSTWILTSSLNWCVYYRPRVQHDYPTMVSMELQRTSTEDSEEDSSRVKTANTNRRLVPLTKGDIIIDNNKWPDSSQQGQA